MANVESIKFPALKITGANYIAWTTDVELFLVSMELSETIKEGNTTTSTEKAKAIIFLRKHLDESVTHDYANIKDPAELWSALKKRFDNQREITLPHALEEWKNLRFQDFEKVDKYNSVVLRIVSQLKYCGREISEEEMIEKTLLTFHKEHSVLPTLYRSIGYKRFSDLIVALILAEKNNELLIQNHNSRPTGTRAYPEVNAANVKYPVKQDQAYRGRGRGRGRGGRGHHFSGGRGHHFSGGRGGTYNPRGRGSNKWFNPRYFQKGKETQESSTQKRENVCFKCGKTGHYFRVCRTDPQSCELYQKSIKGKGKEVNLTEHFEGTTYLDSSDFVNDFGDATFAEK